MIIYLYYREITRCTFGLTAQTYFRLPVTRPPVPMEKNGTDSKFLNSGIHTFKMIKR